ncbi:imelysin family protein [Aliiroseovarius sp. S1339]|uniref:imelysin family protein n=1 Tax=Aliiroseovarius sp. S1339 TaxID=2936990 RepID=UPI0020BD7353|nr:imelysin family protein [Aliiroseovarius sp. S1339]MCK8464212.1 imelysin family protein [Aliiroseovarius sp. S1339]
MKRLATFVAACLMPIMALAADPAPTTDHAAVAERVIEVLQRQFGAFRKGAATLADQSRAFCDGDGSRKQVDDAFAATWRAWAPLDAYQFGPIETQAAALTVNFFPDKKNFVGRAVSALLKRPDSEQADPTIIAASSAAGQGLPALERLLFDDQKTCPALVGVSANLARIASDLHDGWFAPDGWAALVMDAGSENPVYLSHREFTRQMYTAIGFSIMRLRDHRIGRPLGTYARSFPKRSEAWRSGLTNDLMIAQLGGITKIVEQGFAGAIPDLSRASIAKMIDDTQTRVRDIGAPLPQALNNPQTRFRVEALQNQLDHLQSQLDQHVGAHLDVEAGFSAGDGD